MGNFEKIKRISLRSLPVVFRALEKVRFQQKVIGISVLVQ